MSHLQVHLMQEDRGQRLGVREPRRRDKVPQCSVKWGRHEVAI